MKIFSSTDLEGVSGIVSWQQTGPEGGQYYSVAVHRDHYGHV